jgi:hypothetical protein
LLAKDMEERSLYEFSDHQVRINKLPNQRTNQSGNVLEGFQKTTVSRQYCTYMHALLELRGVWGRYSKASASVTDEMLNILATLYQAIFWKDTPLSIEPRSESFITYFEHYSATRPASFVADETSYIFSTLSKILYFVNE